MATAVKTGSSYGDTGLFRDLYTRVLRHGGEECGVLGITSAIDGEGKSTVVRSLALMLANDQALAKASGETGDILVLDCNQRADEEEGVTREFMVDLAPGLIQYLGMRAELEEAVKPTFLDHLWVMPIGGTQHNFSVLIRTPRMEELMEGLRARFELIIMDLPSVLATTDAQVLGALADQIALVVRAGVTPRRLVSQALDEMDREKLVGTVLNDVRPDLPKWLSDRL